MLLGGARNTSNKFGRAKLSGVCIISQYWKPDVNGDVTRLAMAIAALRGLGHEVILITSVPHYPMGDKKGFKARLLSMEKSTSLTTVRIWMPSIPHTGFGQRMFLYAWFAAFSALPTLVFGRRKRVWAFSQRVFSTYTAFVARLAWRAKVVSDLTDIWPEALVNTGHATEPSMRLRAARVVARFAYRHSFKITTLTEQMRNLLVTQYGLPSSKVLVIPNFSEPLARSRVVNGSRLTLLYYGNIGSNYDFDPVLNLADTMRGTLDVVLIGDGELLQWVRRRSAQLRLNNVEIVGRTLTGEALWREVSRADALVLPMREGPYPDASFPTKFVEYMSLGRPIVYLGSGYLARLIRENGLGVVASKGDLSPARAYLEGMAMKRESGVEAGRHAQQVASSMFSHQAFVESLEALFR